MKLYNGRLDDFGAKTKAEIYRLNKILIKQTGATATKISRSVSVR